MMRNKLRRWEIQHWQDVLEELASAEIALRNENIEKIIDFMSFDSRSKRNPGGCTLYPGQVPCHPGVQNLNCLLCACPNYDSSTAEGACRMGSRRGFYYNGKDDPTQRVWDCSKCTAYHSPGAVRAFLKDNMDQLRLMSDYLSKFVSVLSSIEDSSRKRHS